MKHNKGRTRTCNIPESREDFPARLKYFFIILRPKQWIKNLLLFTALIFSLNEHWDFSDVNYVLHLLGIIISSFFIFCLLSSATYIINDIIDIDIDRHHPDKKSRPLASGKLNLKLIRVMAVLLSLITLSSSYFIGIVTGSGVTFGVIATLYLVFSVGYSLFFKNIVILDIFTIATGFVLRVIAGAVILNFPISPWLYICAMLLALFLALIKRRNEKLLLSDDADNSMNYRKTLSEYSVHLIDEMLVLIATAAFICYCLYTISAENLPKNHTMMLTIPFVLYGLFRYFYLIHIRNVRWSTEEMLFKDKPLIITVVFWILTASLVLLFSGL